MGSRIVPYDPHAAASLETLCDDVLRCEARLNMKRRDLARAILAAQRTTLTELPADALHIICAMLPNMRGTMRRLCRRFAFLFKCSTLHVHARDLPAILSSPRTYLARNPTCVLCPGVAAISNIGYLLHDFDFSRMKFIRYCLYCPPHNNPQLHSASTELCEPDTVIIDPGTIVHDWNHIFIVDSLHSVSAHNADQMRYFLNHHNMRSNGQSLIVRSQTVSRFHRMPLPPLVTLDVESFVIIVSEYILHNVMVFVTAGTRGKFNRKITTRCSNVQACIDPDTLKQLAGITFTPPMLPVNDAAHYMMPNSTWYRFGAVNE